MVVLRAYLIFIYKVSLLTPIIYFSHLIFKTTCHINFTIKKLLVVLLLLVNFTIKKKLLVNFTRNLFIFQFVFSFVTWKNKMFSCRTLFTVQNILFLYLIGYICKILILVLKSNLCSSLLPLTFSAAFFSLSQIVSFLSKINHKTSPTPS